MSKETTPNPPAFPEPQYTEHAGMNLRDYFAAKAMQAVIPIYHGRAYELKHISQFSYELADEMLKARQEVKQEKE